MSILAEIRSTGASIRLADGQIALKGGGTDLVDRIKAARAQVLAELRREADLGESAYRKMDEMLDIAYLFRRHGADRATVADLVGMLDTLQELALTDYHAFTLRARELRVDVMAVVKAMVAGEKVCEGHDLAKLVINALSGDQPKKPHGNIAAFSPAAAPVATQPRGNMAAFAPDLPKQEGLSL